LAYTRIHLDLCLGRKPHKLIQEIFETVLIPPGIGLPPLDNKGGIGSNAMAKGFIDSHRRMDIDEFDEETMSIETSQFSDPLG